MKSRASASTPKLSTFVLLLAAFCGSCSSNVTLSAGRDDAPSLKVDQPFPSAGSIEMQLDVGSYNIRSAANDRIRVTFSGNIGNATAALATNGSHAMLVVKDTPHNNFKATVEVPRTADLVVRHAGGDLDMAAIAGNKDIDSKAGDLTITAGSPNDYSTLDATVKIGDLDGGPFGSADGDLSHHLAWSGHGKYTFRASLGAGDLKLK
jgi:hypothetical protein